MGFFGLTIAFIGLLSVFDIFENRLRFNNSSSSTIIVLGNQSHRPIGEIVWKQILYVLTIIASQGIYIICVILYNISFIFTNYLSRF